MGGRRPHDWCGRAVLYSFTHPSSAACNSPMVANIRSFGVKNSSRIVLCSRSTFPVVVGEYGAVSRCLMPLSAQIRAGHHRPGPAPNRAVNTFPLSVKIWEGTPCRASASLSAWHTGRAVGSCPAAGVNDNGRRFLQELPTRRRKDYARVCSSIAY